MNGIKEIGMKIELFFEDFDLGRKGLVGFVGKLMFFKVNWSLYVFFI